MNKQELKLEERKIRALESIAENVEILARFIEENELRGIPVYEPR
ncbi:hypothetical protein SDC9_07472 [bioreactor metagenome]|uniref:Uncharacterized protein n=1 Tax=bioreactor metagenome TaxID=1076179 RepID=A0A644T4N3_9ZZZZ|nr:hypothetical protein [Methanobrevibacter sp.]MEA4956928.1 hypothetical protein [Methanobrevibacter sp.]